MNTDIRLRRYSTVAILLHWGIAVLLIFQVALGFRMEGASGSAKFAVFQLHKSIGIAILLLVAIRLLWRLVRTPPPIHAKPWETALAHGVHLTLYALMFALPITGWIIVSTSRIVVPTLLFGTVPWPHVPVPDGMRQGFNAVAAFLHGNLAWVLIGLFALHVAGALKHHVVDRDGELDRMAPGVRAGAWGDPRLLAIALGVLLAAGLGWRWLPIGAAPAKAAAIAPVEAPVTVSAPVEAPAPTPTATPSATPTPEASPTPVAKKATGWTIARSSTLTFRTSWSGDPIDGGFKTFDGTILFAPGDLEHSKVAIAIDIGSVYSGDAQRDETLKSEDWFAAGAFGKARFAASTFRSLGGDRYAADGTLTIKGVTRPSSVRFTLKIAGDKATMRGTASVSRTAYRIGTGEYESTTDIPAAVAIGIAVDAMRVK